MVTALPDDALPLFRVAPDRFIAARDGLIGTLREQDRPADAAAVEALRKPTIVTWTLNQLMDRDPDGVTALLDAGAAIRVQQQAAIGSSTSAATGLREATASRRAAVTQLSPVARAALSEVATVTPGHTDAIRRALEAASTDVEAGERLRTGTFERPPADAAGFGDLAGLRVVADGNDRDDRAPTPAPGARSARARPAPRAGERASLRRDRDAAVREARKAREAADRYGQELAAMRRRIAVVEGKHAAAEAEASRTEVEAKRVERALAGVEDPGD